LENGESKNDKISGEMWKIVETKTGKVRVAETKERRGKKRSQKEKIKKRKEKKRKMEVRKIVEKWEI